MPGLLPDVLQNPLPDPLGGLPPGRQIGPTGPGSQAPPINPVMGPAPAGPGISALFGGEGAGSPGAEALSAAGAALARSGQGTPDFTPSTLQSIVSATQAGRDSLESSRIEARAAAAAENRKKALAKATNPSERRAVFHELMAEAAANNDTELLENLGIAAAAHEEEFTYESVGDRLLQFNKQGKLVGSFNEQIADMIASMTPEQAKLVLPIQNQFESKVKATRDVANSFRRVRSATQTLIDFETEAKRRSLTGEPDEPPPIAAAMAALSSFARLLDPGSVVRTEEYKLVAGLGSIGQKIRSWYDQILTGTIPADLAQSIQDEARRQTRAQQGTFNAAREEYFRRIKTQAGVARTPEIEGAVISPFDLVLNETFADGEGLAPMVPGPNPGPGPGAASSSGVDRANALLNQR